MRYFLQIVRSLVITTLLFVWTGYTHLSWGQTTVGPSFAGTGADVTGVGTVNWTNPGRVTANDNSFATVTVNGSASHYLQATNYGFSIPSNAVINGITVTVGRYGTTGAGEDVRDNVVSLVKGGVISGSNYAVTGTDWTNTESAIVYGDAANLWGTSWTPAEINTSNFGVALAVNSSRNKTAYVDYIQVTVNYVVFTSPWVITTAGASNFTVPAGVSCIQVEVWGGGGRGGSRTGGSGGYGGGGGGAYSRNVLTVIPGNTYTLYTGAGSTTTANGEDSYFINTTTVLAKGGGSVPNNSGTGASGGAAANGYGDVKWSGGNGANGVAGSYGGGGGSSAGSALNGNTATNATGATAPSGGGNGGNGKTGTSGNGSPGFAPGGGGGGALRTGGGAVGGTGADGQIIISWGSLTTTNTPVVSSPIFSDAATISGTSEANAVVVVYSGGSTQIGTGTANGSGVWSATVSALTTGQSITATAKVVDKCLSSESAPVIVSAAPPITTGTISPATFCAGSAVSIPYTISVIFTAGNVFTAQLSDAGGSFTTPVTLGTLTSTAAGTISGTIPPGTSTGTAYRIRVVSSNPAVTGINNGVNLTVNATPSAPAVGTITQPTCTVATGSVVLSGLPSGTWILNPGSISGSGLSTTRTGLVAGTYNFTVTNSSGCVSTASGNVVINTQPSTPSITGTSPGAICGAGSVTISATASAGTINWYDASTGGSSLGTGTTFTTPVLSSSTSYYVDATLGGCTSTPRMAALASIIPAASIAAGGAGTFCSGTTITLTSSGTNITNQYWEGPDSFYSNLQNPTLSTATTAMSGTYTVTGSSFSGINLVTNGDFEAGNSGIGSSYGYVAPAANVLTPEGLYTIVANPNSVHDGFTNCADYTPAGTLQMVINGAVVAGMNVWSQTVNVVPNTDYQFTYWIQSVVASNPSQLQLYANGFAAGPIYTANLATCSWKQFTYNWNSGASTTAYLSLVNQNIIAGGNDFTLDDIVFQQVCSATSSVDVTVNADVTAGAIGSSHSICRGYTPATLNSVTAGTGSGIISYEWQTNASGSFVTIGGATAAAYSPPALIATTIYQRRTVSVSGGTTCYSPYSNQITITVTGPVAVAGGPNTVCQAASAFALSGASFSGGATSAAWSIISGGGTLSSTAYLNTNALVSAVTYTPAVGYTGTVILRLTTAGGSCAAIAERTITITPTVGTPVFIPGATSTRCQGAGSLTYTATATNTTGITYTLDAASVTGGNSIVAGTGAVTYVAGWSGTSTITASAAGCNGPRTATHTVTITPTVGTPVFTLGATSTRCQGAGSVTYTATATNTTGITYMLDAASVTGGNSIVAGTGAVTYVAGWSGTSTITASAAGCNGPKTATHTVTITPTVGTPVFTPGATSTRCQGAGSVTYTATATNTSGITYTLDAASLTGGNSIVAGTGAVTYVAGWSGTSTITASAAGCSGPTTATHTVTITPTVGTPVFTPGATSTRCQGSGSVTYTATATNTTGITYTLDAASVTGGNSIVAGTGVVTYVAGWSGTSTITASAAGCNGPTTATHTVSITPTVGTPVFTLGASSTRCQGAGSITYTATATNTTGITYTLDAASVTGGNSIVAGTGAVTYVAGWTGTSSITASAPGCNGPATATHTVTINSCINKWKGTISSNWSVSGNWTLNYVPAVDAHIIFDDAPVNHCLLDQDRSVTDITNAQSTYRLVTNGYKLTIKGNLNFSNGARIDASNTNSSVELAGASAQSIPAGTFYTDEVYNLIVNNANNVSLNGTLRLLNSLSAASGLLDAMTNASNVIYAGTVAQTIGSQFLNDEMFHLTVDNSAGLTLNSNFILSNDLVINAGKLFSIAAGKTLSVSGAINNSAGSAGFVLQSDASGTASLIHQVDNVQATVNRYISGADEAWHFLSSPVSNQSIDGSWLPSGTYGNGTGYDLYAWNEPTYCWIYKLNTTSAVNWNTVHPGSDFEAGRGYLYSNQVSGTTKAFLGNLNNGSVSYSLTTSSTDLSLKGFNLIGNPYPSSIDWQTPTGWSRSNLLDSGGGYDMWIWNPTADNYGVFNSFSGVGTNDVIRYIAPMQGYFVRAETAGNLGTDNSVRIHDGTGAWKSAKINQEMLSLVVRPATGTRCDETRIMFGYEASQTGAAKLFSPVVTAPSLYLPSGSENYSVRYLTDTIDYPFIPVMFKAGTDGSYILSCSFDETVFKTVLLKDRQKNIWQNLKEEKIYRFKASAQDDPDRFVLYFKPVTTGSEEELPVRIYTNGIGLIVDLRLISQETEVFVYDLIGRKLLEKKLQGGNRHTLDLISVTQILIVSVKNQNGSLSRKLFWGN